MSSGSAIAPKSNMQGIVYMMMAILLLSSMDAVAKSIVEANYSVFQLLAFRSWFVLGLLTMWMIVTGNFKSLKTKHPGIHFVRAVLGFMAPLLFFTALADLPLADTTILFFVAPFIMTALSVPMFKEKVGKHRWAAILVGFAGVMIVTQPGSGSFQMAALLPLGAAVCYALIMLLGRWLGSTDSKFSILFYVAVGTCVFGTASLPWVWKPMPINDVMSIGIMALMHIGGSFCILQAFLKAEIGAVTPFEYSGILWAALFGFIFWGDVPSDLVFLGGGLVALSGLYMVYRENKLSRQHKTKLDHML